MDMVYIKHCLLIFVNIFRNAWLVLVYVNKCFRKIPICARACVRACACEGVCT